jgi:hypothetical protein
MISQLENYRFCERCLDGFKTLDPRLMLCPACKSLEAQGKLDTDKCLAIGCWRPKLPKLKFCAIHWYHRRRMSKAARTAWRGERVHQE